MAAAAIDTGDVIRHRPSGEEWLVAYVAGEHLVCCGWPYTAAPLTDCEVIGRATELERLQLIRRLADMTSNDCRREQARRRLISDPLLAAALHQVSAEAGAAACHREQAHPPAGDRTTTGTDQGGPSLIPPSPAP